MIKDGLEQGADVFIHGGDWFHSRKYIDHPTLVASINIAGALNDAYETIYIMDGNHDMHVSDTTISANTIFKPFSNIEVISRTCVRETRDHIIGFIPYSNNPDTVEKRALKIVRLMRKSKKTKILVAHLGICGGRATPSNIEIPGNIPQGLLQPEEFDHVILGHYHKPQQLETPKMHYVGSLFQTNWGEMGERKRYLLCCGNQIKSRWNPVMREHLEIQVGAGGTVSAAELKDVKSNIVKFKIEESDLTDFKTIVPESIIKASQLVIERTELEVNVLKLNGLDHTQAFLKYIEANIPDYLDKEVTIRAGLAILTGVQEK